MDATIIVAIVTGIFSVLTILLQHRNTKDSKKLEAKNKLIQRKNAISSQLSRLKDDANLLYQDRVQLILDSNIEVLKSISTEEEFEKSIKAMAELAKQLNTDINKIHEQIDKKRNEFYALEKIDEAL